MATNTVDKSWLRAPMDRPMGATITSAEPRAFMTAIGGRMPGRRGAIRRFRLRRLSRGRGWDAGLRSTLHPVCPPRRRPGGKPANPLPCPRLPGGEELAACPRGSWLTMCPMLAIPRDHMRRRPYRGASGGLRQSMATPVISMEITVLDDREDVFTHRDADALTIARMLMVTVLTRFNLVWRVRRGDCPRGRRLAPPWLRAWDDPGDRDWRMARQRPVRFEGPLAQIDDVSAAIVALCAYEPSNEELSAIKELWPAYRFSSVIRAKREAVARLDRRSGYRL